MKLVRIDNKTVIEVDGRISDERAREEYLKKLKRGPVSFKGTFKKEFK